MTETENITPQYEKLYYDTGELRYEGYCKAHAKGNFIHPAGEGIEYYKDGTIFREGVFQRGGLLKGKEYYPNGKLKFDGQFNCRQTEEGYYGPSYPVHGKFYTPDGALDFEGDFKIEKRGSIGYPVIVKPEGFGSLK